MYKQTIISLLLTTSITLYGMDKSLKTNTTDPQIKFNEILNEIINKQNTTNNIYSVSELPKSRLFIITKRGWTPKKDQQSKL
jgi:hypothetical protein